MTGFTVRSAEPRELAEHWRTVEPLFASALPVALGRYEPIDLLMMSLEGRFQPWFALDAAGAIRAVMLTAVQQYPRRRCCLVFLIAGDDMASWLDTWAATIETYAREQGCDHIEGQGRIGWERTYPGARRAGTVLVKDL